MKPQFLLVLVVLDVNLGILGTRGIPNNYGGFEQFAEFLAVDLVKQNHEVVVYSTSDHVYKNDDWKGVTIVHCSKPETYLGSAGQFLYDLNCILDSRKQDYDIILQLGYTSSSLFFSLHKGNTILWILSHGRLRQRTHRRMQGERVEHLYPKEIWLNIFKQNHRTIFFII